MGFALASLMAYLFVPTLVLYSIGLLITKKRALATASRIIGFIISLPAAAISALILAPETSVISAESMFWPGSLVGSGIGLAVVLLIGKRKSSGINENSR